MRKASYFASAGLLIGLTGCSEPNARVMTKLNRGAALSGNLPSDPLKWEVITSAVNHQNATMYTVFGNDQAVQYARTHAQHDYPAGSVVSLVTWNQQEDPRWFGGRIPLSVNSVEFLSVNAGVDGRPIYRYEKYDGTPLKKALSEETAQAAGRAAYLLSQRAAVMP
jgi:hypothetical protein